MVKIKNIFWKRTYLFIEYEADKPASIVLKGDKKSYILETKELENGCFRSKINTAIVGNREILPPGKWHITLEGGNCELDVDPDVLTNIECLDKVFRYSKDYYAYIATFSIDNETNLYLNTDFMKKNRRYRKRHFRDVIKEELAVKKRIKNIAMFTAKKILNICYVVLHKLTFRKNTILFMTENHDSIRDNMKAVDNRIKERGLDKKYHISYSVRNIFGKRQSVTEWFKTICKVAKQEYIFVDDYVPIFSFLNVSSRTKVIQLWHAGFGFKAVGYGRFGIDGSPHPFESCHRKYSYAVTGNEHLKEIYSEVFGIDEEFLLATGMPRLEHFLDEDKIEEFRASFYEEHPELSDKRIVMFAPTYRGASQYEAYYDYDMIDFDGLYKSCEETDSIIIFKQHHFITEKIPYPEEYNDRFYEMSEANINELFYVTDVLITDYSSCFYDFLLLQKPVIFYVYDKDVYSATRRVHRPIDKVAPGRVCVRFDEVIDALGDVGDSHDDINKMLTDNCLTNTKMASDIIIDSILK